MIVCTPQHFEQRKRELELQYLEAQEKLEEENRNKGFTQTYPQGWKRIRELIKINSGAANLYTFLAEHLDPICGAVVADQKFLAEQLECSTRTIQRQIKFLEEKKALVKIPIAGRVCAYALNPYEVWKSYDSTKKYAAFITKTLVNKEGDIKRRIMSMFSYEPNENNQ